MVTGTIGVVLFAMVLLPDEARAQPAEARDPFVEAFSAFGKRVDCPQPTAQAWADFAVVCAEPPAEPAYLERRDALLAQAGHRPLLQDKAMDATGVDLSTKKPFEGRPVLERRFYVWGGRSAVFVDGPELLLLATTPRGLRTSELQHGGGLRMRHPLEGRSLAVYPERIDYVAPKYPKRAKKARAEGRVVLKAVIAEDGRVTDVQVVEGSVPQMGFEQAAIQVVKRWRYRPAAVDGEPFACFFTIVIDFELSATMPRRGRGVAGATHVSMEGVRS